MPRTREPAVKFVEYHSKDWDLLVETGWVTWSVETNADGVQIATMKQLSSYW